MPKQNTNTRTPNPSNPSSLPDRYSIRRLTRAHAPIAGAIISHANMLCSPVWPLLYPVDKTARLHACYATIDYLVTHQIDSGMSYGVFDDEYVYRNAEAKQVGEGAGKVFWDVNEKPLEDDDAERKRLLEQMDSPLVSVALSYDAAVPLDMEKMSGLIASLPHYPIVFQALGEVDTRDPTSWQATGPEQVLMRNATATRYDYEGQGIMGGMARWLMREAAEKGYRGIQIECLNDPVTHVWSKPEEPFKGGVVCEFDMGTWKDEEGKVAFEPATTRVTKCYVDLKPEV